jgi:hypothetical protein
MAKTVEFVMRFSISHGPVVAVSAFLITCCLAGDRLSRADETIAPVSTLVQTEQSETKESRATKEVIATMKAAIKTWEAGKYQQFLESYIAVDQLQRIRRKRFSGTDVVAAQFAAAAKRNPEQFQQFASRMWLGRLKKAVAVKPTFDRTHSIALFSIVLQPEETITAQKLGLFAVKIKDVKVAGYGLDLKETLEAAVKDLKAGNVASYLKKMMPVSELQLGDPAKLAARIKASPQSLSAIQTDITAAITLVSKAKIENGVAEISLPRPSIKQGVGRNQTVIKFAPKVFKFQKVGPNWRLYDNTTALKKTLTQFQQKIPPVRTTFVMEKFGNHWRFSSINLGENDSSEFGFDK